MVQHRDIVVCIILSIVTCGIYGIYWFICLTDDTNAVSGNMGDTSGVIAFLLSLITCNIYGLYWAYRQGEKIDQTKNSRGILKQQWHCLPVSLPVWIFHRCIRAHAKRIE